MSSILDGLNEAQRAAAEQIDGAALIVAGAGSGKTRTITYRIAHMIESGIKPWNILALTFTNKAAREMRERIETVVPPAALRGLWMGTFHGVFRRILSKEAERIGFRPDFTIYETADSRNLLKTIVRELELPEERYKPNAVHARISLAKNALVTPAAYAANETARADDTEAGLPELYRVYELYCRKCKANGAMDFDDILLYMNILLRDCPEVADQYAELFRYIMVDEYQDTNFAQYLIVRKLAAAHGNVCVVGDDAQSIYSFRGARIENILKFQKDFPDCKVFKLEENYRSTRTIVEAANSLIAHNEHRLEKTLFSRQPLGDKIRVFGCLTDKHEAARVAGDIAAELRRGTPPSQVAILYRTNAQSRAFEEVLRQKNIPYKIYGGQSFYQRAEIKDMLCYFRLAVNPRDDEALKRIINTPARGIGATSLERIEAYAAQNGLSIFEALQQAPSEAMGIRGVAQKGIVKFLEAFSELSGATETLDAYEFASAAAKSSGLVAHYSMSKAVEDQTRLENIEELLNSIKSFVASPPVPDMGPEAAEEVPAERSAVTIGGWLSEVSLLTDADQEDEKTSGRETVTLLTAHSSKGLEFDCTYLVGLEEQLFPSLRADENPAEEEEERRLFYVALTRARKRATISYAAQRFKWGDVKMCSPSRFVDQIDEQYLDRDDDEAPDADYAAPQAKPRWQHRWEQRAAAAPTPPKPTVGATFRKMSSTDSVAVQSDGQLAVGVEVAHPRFGRGRVVGLEKTPSDTMVEVEFTAVGRKTLLLRFAKLELV